MRLRQHQHFEHLVKRAVASGEEDCARRVLHEHGLADEEIAELDSEIYPIVGGFFEGELNGKTHRSASRKRCSTVGRLHDAGAAAGNDSDVLIGKLACNLHGVFIVRVGWFGSSRSEYGYRRP